MKIDWSSVPILNNSDVFVTINKVRGTFYFSRQLTVLIGSCNFKYAIPLLSKSKKSTSFGFKFTEKYVLNSFAVCMNRGSAFIYCKDLASTICCDEDSLCFDLMYDEENDVWYFTKDFHNDNV